MIRRLTPEDASAFAALRLLGFELHPDAFATGAAAWRAATPQQTGAAVQPGADPTSRFVLGAFDGELLVGQIGFRREPRPAVAHKGSLWGFVVHPDYRRRGLGSGLLKAALEELRACEGLQYVRLVTNAGNEDVMRLFASHGFEQYGLEGDSLRAGNAYFDQAYMRRAVDR